MPFGKLQCTMTRQTNFRRGGARLVRKGIASASDNVEIQNCYQLQAACWQHSQLCWVSQASALLKSYNCPSHQNILARERKWEQHIYSTNAKFAWQLKQWLRELAIWFYGLFFKCTHCMLSSYLNMAAAVSDLSSSAMLTPSPVSCSAWYNFASSVWDSSGWAEVGGRVHIHTQTHIWQF